MTSDLERLKAKGEGKLIPEAPSKGSKVQNGPATQPFEPFEGDRERGFRRRETDADAMALEGEASSPRRLSLSDGGRNCRRRRLRQRYVRVGDGARRVEARVAESLSASLGGGAQGRILTVCNGGIADGRGEMGRDDTPRFRIGTPVGIAAPHTNS
jgi:hypothetical protein